MDKIIIICGPTGIGKTSFAVSAAETFNGEIIGADSMQIYKFMDIGTAKPDAGERALARHHLIDFVDPADDYDAGRFVRDADAAIDDVTARGKIPIVAGGTGLYLRALVHGLFRSEPADPVVLERLNRELADKGPESLFVRLQQCDPESALKIHPNDSFRVIRALEVYESASVTMSGFQASHQFSQMRYDVLKLGLTMDRGKLYERINQRVDMMLEAGLLNETVALIEKGYSLELKSMQCIGYRQMGYFINGEVSWEEAVRLLKRDTRRYAKRQFTWFNKDKDIHWFAPDGFDQARTLIKEFLT